MKREADFEMRPEYDFSGGRRGRHAARFSPAEREELVSEAAIRDAQNWTASALLRVQELEAALFAYLVLAEKRSPEEAGSEAVTLLDGRELLGLGRVLSSLRDRGLLLRELDERLTFVAKERNWLLHRSGIESQAALSAPEKALHLLDRLEVLATEASAVKSRIHALVAQHLTADGYSTPEITAKTD
ncbi:MAG: hypothetical protein ICV87_08965, partial [Gemmatimonadetes bacterium]|nr:hypothetical protein [Gemmatimonadota bacterium]